MPIRLRLALIVTLVASILVLVGGTTFEMNLSGGMRATLEDFLRRSALRLERDLADHRVVLAAPTASVRLADDQSTLQVLSRTGRVVYATTRAGSKALVTAAQRRSALRSPIFLQRSRAAWHDPRLVLAKALPGNPNLVLVVGASLDELTNARSRLLDALFVGGPLVVTVLGVGSWFLAGVALRPVERLRSEAMAISTSDPDRRLATPNTHDEIARLGHTLNGLLDLLQGAIARQREFVAVASHELRTPLAVVRAEVELAQRPGRTDTEMRASLDAIASRVAQLVRLSDDLLLLASNDEGGLALCVATQELEPLVAGSLKSLSPAAAGRGISLVLDADPGVRAPVDAYRFQQIIDNLVANAMDHAAGTPFVEVCVRQDGEHATVAVEDRGPGFPDGFLPQAFERFTRGTRPPLAAPADRGGRHRSPLRGVGLGLAVVRLLVEAHGGAVDAGNRPGGGARVVVTLPCTPEGSGPGSEGVWAAAQRGAT